MASGLNGGVKLKLTHHNGSKNTYMNGASDDE